MGAMQAAFVKFFGRAGTRTAWDAPVLEVLARTGAHWAIRVHDGEFVAGTLADAVSLGELMDALGAEAFATTQRNALIGAGNVDPRQAYRQQPAVRLSHEGAAWLDARLEEAFARAGRLSAARLAQLDWPTEPRTAAHQGALNAITFSSSR
jgi:hypothetical protein